MTRRDPRKEPQPYEASYTLTMPPLPKGSQRGAALELAVQRLADWLAQQAAAQQDDEIVAEFVRAQAEAATMSFAELQQGLEQVPWLYAHEFAALGEGISTSGGKRWSGVVDSLSTGTSSPEFLRIVAALIEANLLHSRGQVRNQKPRNAVSEELKRRRDVYSGLLKKETGAKKGDCNRWAKAAIALEERRVGETLERAQIRISNDIKRTEEARKLGLIEDMLRACRIVQSKDNSPRP